MVPAFLGYARQRQVIPWMCAGEEAWPSGNITERCCLNVEGETFLHLKFSSPVYCHMHTRAQILIRIPIPHSTPCARTQH